MFADGTSRYTAIGGRSGLATFHAAFAEVLAGEGRLAEAIQIVAEARAWLDRDQELWNHTPVLIAEAMVAAGSGDGERAAELLERAVTVAEAQEAWALARRAHDVADTLGTTLPRPA